MAINTKSLNLIKRFEGCKLTAYKCPAGVWTIGYGHTGKAGPPAVHEGEKITKKEAENILCHDLKKYEAGVDTAIKVPLTENQRGALVSLCYNIGPAAFKKSTVVKRLNAGNFAGAAEAITWWNKVGGKTLRGLVRRRESERQLFLTDDSGTLPPPEEDSQGDIKGGEQKHIAKSTTLAATLGAAVAKIGAVFTALGNLDPTAQYILIGFTALSFISLIWIVRERIKRWAEGN